jgi:GntR family transcriptional regulator
VTLFNFALRRGTSIIDQVVFAALRSILKGEYRTGQPFPSVRAIASNLKIHPNTAHKAVQHLIENRWLEAQAGVGTVVATRPRVRTDDWRRALRNDIENLIVAARGNAIDVKELTAEIESLWRQLGSVKED